MQSLGVSFFDALSFYSPPYADIKLTENLFFSSAIFYVNFTCQKAQTFMIGSCSGFTVFLMQESAITGHLIPPDAQI